MFTSLPGQGGTEIVELMLIWYGDHVKSLQSNHNYKGKAL